MKKKFMSIVLAGAMLVSGSAFAYNDVENHWAKPYIDDMKAANVLNQFEGDQIIPDQAMTREECAVLISDFFEQFYGYSPTYKEDYKKFIDLVNEEKAKKIRALSLLTYKSYMTSPSISPYVSEAKIIEGYPSIDQNMVEFRPNNNVTRAEFCKMLVNAIDCFGYMNSNMEIEYFASDADLHWGNGYLTDAYAMKIVNGYRSEVGDYYKYLYMPGDILSGMPVDFYVELRPDGNITRAEAIKMVASTRGMDFIGLADYSNGGTRPSTETELYYIKE